jgi:16S rRNA (cytosine1402-N4)-methyltransferase
MVAEVVNAFAPVTAGLLVDGTVGGGGHAGALLEAYGDSVVLGLDRDAEAVAAAGERLSGYGARVVVRQSGFEDLAGVIASPEVAALGLPPGERGVSPRQGRREPPMTVGPAGPGNGAGALPWKVVLEGLRERTVRRS